MIIYFEGIPFYLDTPCYGNMDVVYMREFPLEDDNKCRSVIEFQAPAIPDEPEPYVKTNDEPAEELEQDNNKTEDIGATLDKILDIHESLTNDINKRNEITGELIGYVSESIVDDVDVSVDVRGNFCFINKTNDGCRYSHAPIETMLNWVAQNRWGKFYFIDIDDIREEYKCGLYDLPEYIRLRVIELRKAVNAVQYKEEEIEGKINKLLTDELTSSVSDYGSINKISIQLSRRIGRYKTLLFGYAKDEYEEDFEFFDLPDLIDYFRKNNSCIDVRSFDKLYWDSDSISEKRRKLSEAISNCDHKQIFDKYDIRTGKSNYYVSELLEYINEADLSIVMNFSDTQTSYIIKSIEDIQNTIKDRKDYMSFELYADMTIDCLIKFLGDSLSMTILRT